jgi:hypothetical protein
MLLPMEIENLEEGDRVLFGDRKQPLKVLENSEKLKVEGPNGAEYLFWEADNGKLLYAQEGKERYASYAEDLRKVGEWRRDGDTWKHTDTGKTLRLEKTGTGFWSIETEPEGLIDKPLYGYTDKEEAEKDVEKYIRKNPEG